MKTWTRIAGLLAVGLFLTGSMANAGVIDDPGGLLYHLDAALGVTTDGGGNVLSWGDQGGATNNFAAPAGKEPFWVANSINSLPAVQFDGSDEELLLNTATGPQTVIAVTRILTVGGLRGIWGSEGADKGIRLRNNTNYSDTFIGDGNDFPKGDINGVRVNGAVTSAYSVGTPHVLAEVRGPNHNATTYGVTSIGEYYPSRDYHGDVAELVVYNHVLNNAQIVAIEDYFGAKYNIATAGAAAVPGRFISGLVGGDLTDPENDGLPDSDVNYNATFASTDEPGFGGGEYSFNVFDNQVGGGNAKWCCNDPGATGHQLDATLDAGPHVLTSFTLTSSNDSPGRDPSVFSIEGSNDGVNFVEIFSYDGSSGPLWSARNQTRLFEAGADFPYMLDYSTFRYNVQDTVGGDHALGEIEYFGTNGPLRIEVGGDGTIGTDEQPGVEQNLVNGPLTDGRVIRIIQNKPTGPNPLMLGELEAFETGTGTNVARDINGGVATQSTQLGGFGPERAIDGNYGNFHHTLDGQGQWWQVALAGDTDLEKVTIHSRQGCCNQGRTADIQVQVFDDLALTNLLFDERVLGIGTSDVRDVPLSMVVSGEVLATLRDVNTYVFELDAAPNSDQIAVPNPDPAVFSTILDVNNATLEVELATGNLHLGDTWTLLLADSFQGSFDQLILPSGFGWNTSNLLVDGTLSLVPEPSTWALALLAFLGLGVFGQRRSRRR